MGRPIQQSTLTIVQQFDPTLSEALQSRSYKTKPYTISGLLCSDVVPAIGAVKRGTCLKSAMLVWSL